MKNLFKISLVLAAGIVFFTACQKDDDVAPQSKEEAIPLSVIANPENPYDTQGKHYSEFFNGFNMADEQGLGAWDVGHVAGMADEQGIGAWDVGHVAGMADEQGIGAWDVGHVAAMSDGIGDWDVSKILTLALDYYDFKGKDTTHTRELLTGLLQQMGSQLGTISAHNDCWIHPDWCKDFTNPVIILNASNGGTAYDRTMKYIAAIKTLEVKIKKNKKIESQEKAGILMAYSIARHTAGLLYNAVVTNPLYDSESASGTNPLYEGAAAIIININTLTASTAAKVALKADVGVPTAIVLLYILNKYESK